VAQEANPRFFEHYLLRVRLKEQLVAFASLLAPSDGLAVNPLHREASGGSDARP
tara:strand:+ start:1462 stop:1623 length:162 start_codon:yes stop_codon:yes gene_type:complete